MLKQRQAARLAALGLGLWGVATLYIRLLPEGVRDLGLGWVGFAAVLPMAWLSVWLARRVARLSADQLMAGLGVVGAVAMTIDGVVLRWAPAVYGSEEAAVRQGAAWLLWGYGVSLTIGLFMAQRLRRSEA